MKTTLREAIVNVLEVFYFYFELFDPALSTVVSESTCFICGHVSVYEYTYSIYIKK